MKINCLGCGHKLELDDVYDDYEGQVKCFACDGMLEMKSQDGALKSVKLVHQVQSDLAADLNALKRGVR